MAGWVSVMQSIVLQTYLCFRLISLYYRRYCVINKTVYYSIKKSKAIIDITHDKTSTLDTRNS